MKPYLLFLLLTFFSSAAFGQQRTIDTQQVLWLSYYQKAHLNERWSVHSELDGRWFIGSWRQQQWLLPRVHVHYQSRGGADIGVGAAYFLQPSPQSDEPVVLQRPEIRPHQELNLKQTVGKLKLEHRYRLEERFQRVVQNNELIKIKTVNKRKAQIMAIEKSAA